MNLERALAYIERGWAIFPLVPNTKKPLTRNGFKDATKSADVVREWWGRTPNANIGIATGLLSGVVVVDVDVKNGAKGRESLASLKGLEPTLTATTPSGGWHLYYLCPERGIRSRNAMLPGIDFKADGGYVVAPGSAIDGNEYDGSIEHPCSAVNVVTAVMSSNGLTETAPPQVRRYRKTKRNATLASLAVHAAQGNGGRGDRGRPPRRERGAARPRCPGEVSDCGEHRPIPEGDDEQRSIKLTG